MAFPTDALYARTEVYHDWTESSVTKGAWHDITSDVYNRDGIRITRGRGDESSDVEPTTIDLTLNNRDGVYSPRNPRSPLYGVIGRNQPLRVTVGTSPSQEDLFQRTVSAAWNEVLYTWDATSEGWAGEGSTAVARVTSPTHDGAGALEAEKTMGSGFDSLRFNDAGGTTGDISAAGSTLYLWVRLDPGAAGTGWIAHIEVQDGSFTWHPGPDVALTPGVWTLVSYAPGALLTAVNALGVQVSATGVNGTGTVVVDTFAQRNPDDLLWTDSPGGADWDVDGSRATHTHPDTNVLRYSYLDAVGEPDHRVRATFDLSAADVTGANVSVWLIARMTDTSNYYALVGSYTTGEVLTFRLHKRVGGVLTSLGSGSITVDGGGVGLGDVDYIGEIYVEGNWVHGKVWRRFSGDEPIAWQQSVEDTSGQPPATGERVGLASRRETGNTNASLQVRFFDFEVVPGTFRATAEVSSWPPRWDVSGNDVYTPIQAAGILRRLEQGQRPLRSAIWRENLDGGPIAFWPLNDGSEAVVAASALPGGSPMAIESGAEFEPREVVPWVEPLMTPADGVFMDVSALVQQPSSDTEWSGDFVFAVEPDAEDMTCLIAWQGFDSVVWWLNLTVNDVDAFVSYELFVTETGVATASLTSGTVSIKDGRVHHVRVTTDNNGANTDWELLFDNSSADSGTTSASWDPIQRLVCHIGTFGTMSFGQVALWDTVSPPFNAANAAVVGRSGELAGDRLVRLCEENGVPLLIIGDTSDTAAMGPQKVDTLLANLRDCEDVDMGVLFEPRHTLGLGYRTRVSLYNQVPRVELDYAEAGHVSPPMEPVEDDQRTRNDITVSRNLGSSVRYVKTSGTLNTSQPWEDPQGVGVYDEAITLNVDNDGQLAGIAEWKVHKGTWDEARYRALIVDMRAAADVYEDAARVDLADVFTVDNPPEWLAAELIELLVEGYEETIGLFDWRLVFNTSPARIYTVGTYSAATDATRVRYDSAYSTTAEAITTGTDTSLDVAIETSRTLWNTGSSSPQFPFDIDLLGSRVTVTAITGAASPQTFTLSATVVNGVEKDIPAGTPVRLWKEARYAL